MPAIPIGTMVVVILSGWYLLSSADDNAGLAPGMRKWSVALPLMLLYVLLLVATWGGLLWLGVTMEDKLNFSVPEPERLVMLLLAVAVGLSAIPSMLLLNIAANRVFARMARCRSFCSPCRTGGRPVIPGMASPSLSPRIGGRVSSLGTA